MAQVKIYRIDIQLSAEPGDIVTHYVRHTNVRSAQAHALEHKVSARLATQSDIVDMVMGGYEPFGLDENQPDTQALPFPGIPLDAFGNGIPLDAFGNPRVAVNAG
jgi:hypothetical protein